MGKHSAGPWRIVDEVNSTDRLVYIRIGRGKQNISTTGVYGRRPDGTTAGAKYTDRFGIERHKPVISAEECRANARLISAAPAYAKAWAMVPDDIKQRIFDALHSPDADWVEPAIAAAEGGDR